MPPSGTTWTLEPHTRGKHLVLEGYMQAWLPIMTRWNGRVLFIDAFAGPGEYSNGEPGSPVIALRALIEHRAQKQFAGEVTYLFIEKDTARSKHLERFLGGLQDQLPSKCKYEVINSTFDETLTDALDKLEAQRANLAPAFVMIDPFGVSETPMRTIKRILRNPKSEVYVSFMYESINRFKEHPNFEKHLDELFGCSEWRQGMDLTERTERKVFFYDLYRRQLNNNGARYVVHFELYDGERIVYAIFFGTNDLQGCNKMKQAIWKAAPFGDFKFRGGQLGQLTLGDSIVDFSLFEKDLHNRFASTGWQKIEAVEDFVKSDATNFHSSHLRDKALKPMEAQGKIEIRPGSRKRSRTYPPGTVLRFLSQPAGQPLARES